jgi:hypothetical protein
LDNGFVPEKAVHLSLPEKPAIVSEPRAIFSKEPVAWDVYKGILRRSVVQRQLQHLAAYENGILFRCPRELNVHYEMGNRQSLRPVEHQHNPAPAVG